MVPFRAFLEGLGAEVAFDGSRIAAALENGDSLELVLGATELTVTQGGRITTLDMGAAPFVRDGHTYIPVRAAAEALGLDVYWDDTYEAAHLTDYAALTGGAGQPVYRRQRDLGCDTGYHSPARRARAMSPQHPCASPPPCTGRRSTTPPR